MSPRHALFGSPASRRLASLAVGVSLSLASAAFAAPDDAPSARPAATSAPATVPAARPDLASDEPVRVEVRLNIGRQLLPAGGGTASNWLGAVDPSAPSNAPAVQQAGPPPSVVPPPQMLSRGYNDGFYNNGGGYYDNGYYGNYYPPCGPLTYFGSLGTTGTTWLGTRGASITSYSRGVSLTPAAVNPALGRPFSASYAPSQAPQPIPGYRQPIQNFTPQYQGIRTPPGTRSIPYPGGGGSRATPPNFRPGASTPAAAPVSRTAAAPVVRSAARR